MPASVWSVCSDPCTATFHCIEPECVRGYAGYSYVPCRSQSVFVRPPAQPIAPVWVKTDHRYLQQPAQLQLIQQFVIVAAGRPWYMMENVCRMCCISTWKRNFMWNSANVHIRKNKHANLFFESSGFAYTLLICCISKWHQLFLRISRLWVRNRDCPSCFGAQSTQIITSSQCQTQKVNNKDNTQTPHRKALGQKWSHNLLAVRLVCSPLCHPAFWNDYCTVFLLNSCVILNIKFHWQHFPMQKKKTTPKNKDKNKKQWWWNAVRNH